MSDVDGKDVRRMVGMVFLLLCSICSASYGAFWNGMEGMRHSYPESGEFDSFYFEIWAPAVCFVMFLLAAAARMPLAISGSVVVIAVLIGVGWVWFHSKGVYGGTGSSLILLMIAGVVAWALRRPSSVPRTTVSER